MLNAPGEPGNSKRLERENMTFGESIKTVFSKYVDFDGRARRSEYWYFTLFIFILDAVLWLLGHLVSAKFGNTLMSLVSLAIFLPSLGVAVRRLHDIGKSGWWVLLIITVIGSLLLIFWWVQDSQDGENEYGPNPKGVIGRSEIEENARKKWEQDS